MAIVKCEASLANKPGVYDTSTRRRPRVLIGFLLRQIVRYNENVRFISMVTSGCLNLQCLDGKGKIDEVQIPKIKCFNKFCFLLQTWTSVLPLRLDGHSFSNHFELKITTRGAMARSSQGFKGIRPPNCTNKSSTEGASEAESQNIREGHKKQLVVVG